MKIPIKMVLTLAAVGLLAGTPVFAGSYTNNFDPNQPTDLTFGGNAVLTAYLTNQPQNCVILTDNTAGEQSGITLPDFDTSQAIESFNATFQLKLGPGTSTPADGVSFNFGPDITPGSTYDEEGARGVNDLVIEFDTYNNGSTTVGGVYYAAEAPALDIKYGGTKLALYPLTAAQMVDSQFHEVSIQATRAGKVSVVYQGQLIFTNFLVAGWTPIAGLFNISGRCGGDSEWSAVSQLSINTVLQGTAVTPTILTNPASVTVNEHGTNTFSVAVDGTAPFSFQWVDNGTDIAGQTGSTYTMANIPYSENGHQIKVRVSNSANTAGVTSAAAVLTVIRDTTAPTVVKANASSDGTQVIVVFSKPVDINNTALNPSNYNIDQGVVVSYVSASSATTVVLNLANPLPGGLAYTLSIHGVQDTSSTPNTIAPTQITFRSSLFQIGSVVHKKYSDQTAVNSTTLATLMADPRYPNNPDRQDLMAMFEYPASGGYRDNVADPNGNLSSPGTAPNTITYSDTLECYFIPPTTNDYVFFAAGADLNDVWLSTDDQPVDIVNIAQENGWTNPRDWMVSQCGTTNGERSDWYTANLWPGAGSPATGGALIHLDGGQRYYLLAFHHRDTWSGADDFAVSYLVNPGTNQPASGAAPSLTGSVVGTYLDPTGASVTFSQQPTNETILQGRTATLTAAATGQSLYGTTVAFQWQAAPSGSTTFTNIPGATTSSYTTPALGLGNNGTQFKLLATVPGFTQPSSIATVTVNADTIAPHLVAASALASRSNATFDVGITFDEPLDPVTAGTLANYTVSAGTTAAVQYFAGSPGVVLTVSGLTVGNSYSVTVQNVADPYGNHITSANLPFTVSSMKWGVVGADELNLGNGVVAVNTNGFDIFSDGIAEWSSYDEATFVYEQVTGDFDKELRVEYVDPASQWARAGLIVRDVTNFGVNRNGQTTNGLAGRYQKIHVEPVMTAMGTPGADDYEGNRRLDTGGQTDSGVTNSVTGTPLYPNAWCRIQRVGQRFNILRSDDGMNWVTEGGTTWGPGGDDTNNLAMPSTVYVGPEYSPENGNVSAGFQAMFLAKFRDYRNHATAIPTLTITIKSNSDGTFTLTYTGTLASSDTANGSYNTVSGASSPWTVNPKGTGAKSAQFYRAQ